MVTFSNLQFLCLQGLLTLSIFVGIYFCVTHTTTAASYIHIHTCYNSLSLNV